MASISYAITVCNEHVELEFLLDILIKYIRKEDEIIVQIDLDNCTEEVKRVAEKYNVGQDFEYHKIFYRLNNDFASFKNNLKDHCSKEYIFFIDADEYPSENILSFLPLILDNNNNIDLFLIPRVNKVKGLTQEHISKWGWHVDEHQRVNWPDLQTRIIKNTKRLCWKGKVHERIDGYLSISTFPIINEDYVLFHFKTIEKQEKQNNFYDKL